MKLSCAIIAIAVSMSGAATALAATDNDAGMLAFNNHCRQCHSYKENDNRLGPSLFGVVGRKAGTEKGFNNYSSSLASSGITWTPQLLDQWIANPQAVVRDNNMAPPFGGVADAGQRQAIIKFLEADTNKPKSSAH